MDRDMFRAYFQESKRYNERHAECKRRNLISGCILLQRPVENIKWCYRHSIWPCIWSCLWLCTHLLWALLQWSPISNALQFVETETGDALFHIAKGRARFTDPKHFPVGFFETCVVLRPSDRLRHFTKEALVEQAMQLERIQCWRCALPRMLWYRWTKRTLAVEAIVAEEPRVSGPGFLIALLWRRAIASFKQVCATKDSVPLLDMAIAASVHPSGLMPKDLVRLPVDMFTVEHPQS